MQRCTWGHYTSSKTNEDLETEGGFLPDHDWEQGRANAVTPMAHLFMETLYPEKLNLPLTAPSSGISVTRSGKGINLIYLSHYEPETVFRQLNEILFLMVQPCFDKYFRNTKTGKLKQNFIFIVDNGPSEQPSSTMVQLALVRLCKFLNIDRVVQVSFAEYSNSKRNFVERVHPQVNKALSDHGPFCSHSKYPEVTGPGKEEHRENMEEMAKAVIQCIKCATFGGQYLTVLRGFQEGQWVFNDEDNVGCSYIYLNRIKNYQNLYIRQMITLFYNLCIIFGILTRILKVAFLMIIVK